MHKNILYFGSKSQSRRMLLEESNIPFTVVPQNADESVCDWGLPLAQLVHNITLYKMEHVILPDGKQDNNICFVLTADTMSHDKNGIINGKPSDRNDAIAKIKAARDGSFLCTAFCLDKKIWQQGQWHTVERITDVISAEFLYYIPDKWIDYYLDNIPFLDVSGAIAVEKFGAQFLKYVHGSYSTIVGLPLFEIRQGLEKLGFFD